MTDYEALSMGYSDGDVDTNRSEATSLNELVERRYSRRETLQSGASAAALAVFGGSIVAACDEASSVGLPSPLVVTGTGPATASSGQFVTLQGTATTGSISSASFTQINGPVVTLTGANTATATFIAPAVAASTTIAFRFTATNTSGTTSTSEFVVTITPAVLGFTAVAKNRNDVVTVPAGYTVSILSRLGDPIAAGVSAFANNGTDTNYAQRIGDHGDALYWYGLSSTGARSDNSSTRGLIVQNHENITQQYLHPAGATAPGGIRPEAEAIKEIEAHGVSIIDVSEGANRAWTYNQSSTLNRRITPNTPVQFNGPVRGTSYLMTPHSPTGTTGRGTINNCANGHTLWGTNMTCEENWAGYFRRPTSDNVNRTAKQATALARYGVTSSTGAYGWSTVVSATPGNTLFTRWNATATVGGTATTDWRNEPNQFGWVVEIDPYNPNSVPRKRTALGRMGHEGAWFGNFVTGRRPAWYMGDDARREYIYKFVSATPWNPADAAENVTDRLAIGDKYLDNGTLYVARFDASGTGVWLPLVFGTGPLTAANPAYPFADQADVLTHARLAADALGATPMDRPEWTATNVVTGEVYITLTNNNATLRPLNGTDAANPRHYNDPRGATNNFGNPNGHILRLRETGDSTEATTFTWDIYLFGAGSDLSATNINLSNLDATNDFSSPDGLWFSRPTNPGGQINNLLWIQTDDGAFTDVTNNQMLLALPGTTGDGASRTITNTGSGGATAQQGTIVGRAPGTALKRFMVGPVECEITGVDTTPDGRTAFIGIQHPGEDGTPTAPTSSWPATQATGTAPAGTRPRSAVVVVTKNDGGVVGL